MNHKVAIIWTEHTDLGDDFHGALSRSITDWAEVNQEDFIMLQRWVYNVTKKQSTSYGYKYGVIPILVEHRPSSEMPATIALCKKAAVNFEKEEQKRKEEREQKRKEREDKKQKKAKEDKLATYERLKKELGK